MSTFIPTLSSIGWVQTPEKKADYILSCFITCNPSQTVLYEGKITSLQYLIKVYANREVELEGKLREVLDTLMSNAFKGDKVYTNVRVDLAEPDKPTQLSIKFNCTITVAGVTYVIGKLVQVIDSKIQTINQITTG
jgi:hypothetical protein